MGSFIAILYYLILILIAVFAIGAGVFLGKVWYDSYKSDKLNNRSTKN